MSRSNGKSDKPTTAARDATKPAQRASRRAHRHTGVVADWGAASPEVLHRAIANVTSHGFGISLGYTKDGGALTIRVFGDDTFEPEYVRGSEDLDLYLTGLAEDYAL